MFEASTSSLGNDIFNFWDVYFENLQRATAFGSVEGQDIMRQCSAPAESRSAWRLDAHLRYRSLGLSNKELLICRVINKLDWWAPHIFYMAKHHTLLLPDHSDQTEYHCITLPFSCIIIVYLLLHAYKPNRLCARLSKRTKLVIYPQNRLCRRHRTMVRPLPRNRA